MTITQRQPGDIEDMFFKVHRHGLVISVDCAYLRSGRTVSKNYRVTNSPSGVDIQLTTFSIT